MAGLLDELSNAGNAPGGGMSAGACTDLVIQLQGIVKQLSSIAEAFGDRTLTGTFTLMAAATTDIANTAVQGNSVILLQPTNAAAATLMGGTKSLYYTVSAGVGFTVHTASGVAAAGTETFSYVIITPV